MWGPQAKLVQITSIKLGFMVVITIFRWGYKPTNITGGAPPCMYGIFTYKYLGDFWGFYVGKYAIYYTWNIWEMR